MSMFTYAELVLGVMVVVYIVAKVFKLSTELSMFAAALGGALAGGFWIPTRHIAEGAMTYLDINLIFITATLFMNILKESGGVAFAVRGILRRGISPDDVREALASGEEPGLALASSHGDASPA